MHQPVLERVTRLGSDDTGRNETVRSSVGVDDAVAGLLRSAIYSDNPHSRCSAARLHAARSVKESALCEHFLLVELMISVHALYVIMLFQNVVELLHGAGIL